MTQQHSKARSYVSQGSVGYACSLAVQLALWVFEGSLLCRGTLHRTACQRGGLHALLAGATLPPPAQ